MRLSRLFTAMRRSLIACSNDVCSYYSSESRYEGAASSAGVVANQSSIMEVLAMRPSVMVVPVETAFALSVASAERHGVYMICNSFLCIYSLYAQA